MTRLHYPREFRQQSPVVSVDKKTKVPTQKCVSVRSQCHEIVPQKTCNQIGRKKPSSQRRPGFVPDSGNGRINDLHLTRQLARLAANGEYRARPCKVSVLVGFTSNRGDFAAFLGQKIRFPASGGQSGWRFVASLFLSF